MSDRELVDHQHGCEIQFDAPCSCGAQEAADPNVPSLEQAMEENALLRAQIGFAPEGSHPDEQVPRAETWHRERLNWIAEVASLRYALAGFDRKLTRGDDDGA